jgi:predicted DCC family thiol-disulfide oxidoreductase YuxK
MPNTPTYPIAVLYNGACPFCREQIDKYSAKDKFQRISFTDASQKDFRAEDYGLNPAVALGYMHVMDSEGRISRGFDALIQIWRACGYSILSFFAGLQGIKQIAAAIYRTFNSLRYTLKRQTDPSVCDFHRGKKEI